MGLYALDDYKKHFEDCRECLRLAKKIMGQEGLRLIKPSPAIKKYRNALLRLFSKPEFYQICHQCKGLCCRSYNFSLRPIELLYFVVENPDFELSEPDWRFLENGERVDGKIRFLDSPCLFLTNTGCALKEYQPKVCLAFVDDCDYQQHRLNQKLREIYSQSELEELFFVQASRYNKAIENFCEEILEAADISQKEKSYLETKGDLLEGTVGFKLCIEALEKIAREKAP